MAHLRRFAAASAVVLALCALPATAQASEDALRDRAHSRVAVIMEDAVDEGLFSEAQDSYVTGAIRPAYIEPDALPQRTEDRTISGFWEIVSKESGLSVNQVQSRLRNGSTLWRITGDKAEDVRTRLYNWLSAPAVQALLEGRISGDECADLRDDIQRAVWRVMAQPGGGRDVVLVPRRD